MKIEINLSTKDILEKNFAIDLKGYDVNDVDSFLDLVKKDYEMWELMHEQKDQQIADLKKRERKLLEENTKLKNYISLFKKEIKQLRDKGLGNIDIINRLNKLEEKK